MNTSAHSLAGEYGVYLPNDLAFLGSLYDDIIASQNLSASQQADLAGKLLYLFRGGVGDRERLYIAALSKVRPLALIRDE